MVVNILTLIAYDLTAHSHTLENFKWPSLDLQRVNRSPSCLVPGTADRTALFPVGSNQNPA